LHTHPGKGYYTNSTEHSITWVESPCSEYPQVPLAHVESVGLHQCIYTVRGGYQ